MAACEQVELVLLKFDPKDSRLQALGDWVALTNGCECKCKFIIDAKLLREWDGMSHINYLLGDVLDSKSDIEGPSFNTNHVRMFTSLCLECVNSHISQLNKIGFEFENNVYYLSLCELHSKCVADEFKQYIVKSPRSVLKTLLQHKAPFRCVYVNTLVEK